MSFWGLPYNPYICNAKARETAVFCTPLKPPTGPPVGVSFCPFGAVVLRENGGGADARAHALRERRNRKTANFDRAHTKAGEWSARFGGGIIGTPPPIVNNKTIKQ